MKFLKLFILARTVLSVSDSHGTSLFTCLIWDSVRLAPEAHCWTIRFMVSRYPLFEIDLAELNISHDGSGETHAISHVELFLANVSIASITHCILVRFVFVHSQSLFELRTLVNQSTCCSHEVAHLASGVLL